jgi:hypothetical protein
VKALPKWSNFKADDDIHNILVAISDCRQLTGGMRQNKLWIDADNAHPQIAKVSNDYIARNEMKTAPHPPYSPDLAPSYFFLLGYVKQKLMGY